MVSAIPTLLPAVAAFSLFASPPAAAASDPVDASTAAAHERARALNASLSHVRRSTFTLLLMDDGDMLLLWLKDTVDPATFLTPQLFHRVETYCTS